MIQSTYLPELRQKHNTSSHPCVFPLLFRNCGVTRERDASPYLQPASDILFFLFVLSGRFVVHGKQRAQTVGGAIMQLERCTRTLLNMWESVRETGHRSQQLLSCRYSSVATNAQAPTRSGVPSVSTYFLLLFCVTKVCWYFTSYVSFQVCLHHQVFTLEMGIHRNLIYLYLPVAMIFRILFLQNNDMQKLIYQVHYPSIYIQNIVAPGWIRYAIMEYISIK